MLEILISKILTNKFSSDEQLLNFCIQSKVLHKICHNCNSILEITRESRKLFYLCNRCKEKQIVQYHKILWNSKLSLKEILFIFILFLKKLTPVTICDLFKPTKNQTVNIKTIRLYLRN